jgi:uncharacterized protein YbjQ (UPF0145 family)
MLLTTTSDIPDCKVVQVIGVVAGCSLKQVKGGLKSDNCDPIVQEIKDKAIEALAQEAKRKIADAVVDIKVQFVNTTNTLECYAVGTAVHLDALPAWHLKQLQSSASEPAKEALVTVTEEEAAEVRSSP